MVNCLIFNKAHILHCFLFQGNSQGKTKRFLKTMPYRNFFFFFFRVMYVRARLKKKKVRSFIDETTVKVDKCFIITYQVILIGNWWCLGGCACETT